ncbi:leucine-rich repeat-containing protein let-4-like isoform X2 [Vespula squamosa]|uniref:Leucine-rich repeat-containing protein let-4-like isoform X2 n=1 Tax=Vespula squamosa TaxID=30214 RepID=A0ABD2A5Y8_VESSQ
MKKFKLKCNRILSFVQSIKGSIQSKIYNPFKKTQLTFIVFIMRLSSTFIIHVAVISVVIIHGTFATTISFWPEKFEEDLSFNFIESMDKCDNPEHEIVKLANMGLRVVRDNFVESVNVRSINLEDNDIVDIFPDAFKGVPNLYCLNFRRNYQSNIINSFLKSFNHSSLTKLNLAGTISPYFDSNSQHDDRRISSKSVLPNVTHLDISGNNLVSLPKDLESLFPRLTHLYLSDNKLDYNYQRIIPATVKVLYFERNSHSISWSDLPRNISALFLNENSVYNIYDFPNLRLLSVRKCKDIDTLIYKLGQYKNLVDLDISSNNINYISGQGFNSLKFLRRFSIDKNALSSVSFLIHLSSLTDLSISYNELTNITSDIFSNLRNLKRLNLRGNRMTTISKNAFMNLRMLEKLDLAENKLSTLPVTWMNTLIGLRYLNLKSNLFTSIDSMSIYGYSNLNHLFAQNNSFMQIEMESLEKLPSTVTVHLSSINNFTFSQSSSLSVLSTAHNEIWEIGSDEIINAHALKKFTFIIHVAVISVVIIHGTFATTISFWPEKFEEDLSFNFIEPMDKCDNPEHEIVKLANMGLRVVRDNFVESVNVRSINLEDNDIVDIFPDAFKGVPNLYCLNFRRNYQSNIINSFLKSFNHSSLTKLNLAGTISPYFDSNSQHDDRRISSKSVLPNVTHLDISGNNLVSLPKDLESLFPRLTHLYLSDNKLDYNYQRIIPATVKVLYFERNSHSISWSDLPRNISALFLNENSVYNIYDFPNLRLLSVRKCKDIDTLIYKLGQYKNLVDLDISSNNINYISGQSFNSLKFLRRFSIDKNALSSVSFLIHLSSLTDLSISYNELTNITSDIFSNLRNLKRLNLRGNRMTTISKNAFMNLRMLEKLDLAENKLSTLPVTWMNTLIGLRYLNLKSNLFTSIDSMSIYGYSNLNHLFAQNNSFMQIEMESLEKLPSTVTVHLSSINNFTCIT